MQLETKRLFIPNLPDTIRDEDVRRKLVKYGHVSSIEIKTRKDLGPKHTSYHFAFINIDVDGKSLQDCLNEFSTKNWKGHFVDVQLAKKSFLEQLKQERQEQQEVKSSQKEINNGLREAANTKHKKNENGTLKLIEKESLAKNEDKAVKRTENDEQDMVIKKNTFKTHSTTIPSVGNAPIIIHSLCNKTKQTSKDPYRQQADRKRLQSMVNMKKGYREQKSVIQAALSHIDAVKNKKIVFDVNEEDEQLPDTNKQPLFNDEEDPEVEDCNFRLKAQFQGKGGKELFDLQTRFNNDERFQLDERFTNNEDDDGNEAATQQDDDLNVEQESRQQFKILGEIMGKTFEANFDKPRKTMQRFDPSQPDHAKYEVTDKTKRKKESKVTSSCQEAPPLPETSKELFYKVDDDLKEGFQQTGSFSLLGMFGKSNNTDPNDSNISISQVNDPTLENEANPVKKKSKLQDSHVGSFKGDSSTIEVSKSQERTPGKLWTEPFFFGNDDFRYQEGIDFVKKLQNESTDVEDFSRTRQTLKAIVKRKQVGRAAKMRKRKSKKRFRNGARK